VHLVDCSEASGRPDPVKDFDVILRELRRFGAGLEHKPMIVAASKADAANPAKVEKLRKHARKLGLEFYEISAVTGAGITELAWAMARYVEEVRRRNADGGKVPETVLVDTEPETEVNKQTKGRIPTMAATKKAATKKAAAKKPAAKKTAVKKTAKKAVKKVAAKKTVAKKAAKKAAK
jgi:Fe2+ transport system protein B